MFLETEPLAAQVGITDDKLIVALVDGRSLIVPLFWYPRLLHALRQSGRVGNSWERVPLSPQIKRGGVQRTPPLLIT